MRYEKKIFTTIITTIMIIITIESSTAIDEIITDTNGYWRRLDDTTIVTANIDDDGLIYYNQYGYIKTIFTTPFSANEILRYGTTKYNNQLDLYQVCDATNPSNVTLCFVDYDGNTMSTQNISGICNDNKCYLFAITPDYYIFSYEVSTFNHGTIISDYSFTTTTNLIGVESSCPYKRGSTTITTNCGNVYYKSNGTGYNILWTENTKNIGYTTGSYLRFYTTFVNQTHTKIEEYSHLGVGTDWYYTANAMNYNEPNFCHIEESTEELYCKGKGSDSAYLWRYNNYDYDDYIQAEQVFTGITADYYDRNEYGLGYSAFINNTGKKLLIYNGGTLQNTDSNITILPTAYSYNTILVGDAIVFNFYNESFNWRIVTATELSGEESEIPTANYTNQTAINITTIGNYTTTEYNALYVVDENNVLVAGTFDGEYLLVKLDVTNKENIIPLTNVTLQDLPYKISKSGNKIYVGTDDEIHVIDGYNNNSFTIASTDGWTGLFHLDKAYSISAINTTNAFVCDNHDEPDYYTIGQEPTGNIGGDCYDLSYNNQILIVDRDEQGIAMYNATNPLSITIIDTDDQRNNSHNREYGDLLHYEDTLLVTKNNLNSINVYDTNTTLTLITSCNNGGVGESISVDYINGYAIGGLINGRIMICDITNTNENTNTIWENIPLANEEEIIAIEHDNNGLLHLISTTNYIIMNFSTYNITSNEPPTIENYTVSATEIQIEQPTDITITAGNIEAEDIIYYGIKCEGTETNYDQNTNGEFSCSYDEAGTYQLKIAVSDNYHEPIWYDEKTIEIVVLESVFEGGILRVQIIDEERQPITNAQVNSNNETKYTNVYGTTTFTTPDQELYEITTIKDGYYTTIENHYADGTIHVITMTRTATENETILEVTVIDYEENKIEDAFVTYTNTITYQYNYGYTNALGLIIFREIDNGATIIQATKDDVSGSEGTIIAINQTNQITIKLGIKEYFGIRTERNCIDDKIWLCGQVQTPCETNNDCLSDYCIKGLNTCSKFNYSACDYNNIPRGQRCIIKLTFNSYMNSTAEWILGNLLWVLLLLFVVIAIGFIAISWQTKR